MQWWNRNVCIKFYFIGSLTSSISLQHESRDWHREGDTGRVTPGGWHQEGHTGRLTLGGWQREGDIGRVTRGGLHQEDTGNWIHWVLKTRVFKTMILSCWEKSTLEVETLCYLEENISNNSSNRVTLGGWHREVDTGRLTPGCWHREGDTGRHRQTLADTDRHLQTLAVPYK